MLSLALPSQHLESSQHSQSPGQAGDSSGLTKVYETVTDAGAPHQKRDVDLAKRGVDRHGCYNSGAWMKTADFDKGIQQWCIGRVSTILDLDLV